MSQMIAARAFCGIGGELDHACVYDLTAIGAGLITISQVCAWDLLPPKSHPLYQALNNVTYGVSTGSQPILSLMSRWAQR
jgi:hypothetical protein